MKNFLSFTVLLLGLVFISLPSQASAKGEPTTPCTLAPELLELKISCETGDLPEGMCTWISILERVLAGDDDGAIEGIQAIAGMSRDGAEQVSKSTSLLSLAAINQSSGCVDPVLQGAATAFEWIAQSDVGDESRIRSFCYLYLLAYDLNAIERIVSAHQHITDFSLLPKTLEGLRYLLNKSELWNELLQVMSQAVDGLGLTMLTWDRSTDPYRKLPEELRPWLEPVDLTLAQVTEGSNIEEVERQLHGLVEEAPSGWIRGALAGRIGTGLYLWMRIEPALHFYEQAKLELATVDSLEAQALRLMIDNFRIFLFQFSGQETAALENHTEIENIDSLPIIGDLFVADREIGDLLSKAASVIRDLATTTSKSNPDSDSVQTEKDFDLILSIFEIFFPKTVHISIAQTEPAKEGFSQTPITYMDVVNRMLNGEENEALKKVHALMAQSPHFLQTIPGALLLLPSLGREDYEGMLKALNPLLDLIEREISSYSLDSMSRSFMDRSGVVLFELAVFAAIQVEDPRRAFEYAERGRAFSLRRVGAATEQTHTKRRLSDKERALEDERVAKVRRRELDVSSLEDAFVVARLEAQLSESREGASSVDSVFSLDAVQDALEKDEQMIVYFRHMEGMGIWVLSSEEQHFFPQPWTPSQDRAVRCLSEDLQWDSLPPDRPPAPRSGRSGEAGREEHEPPCEPSISAARDLYDLLIAPVETVLKPSSRLIFVPHGPLHGVPFAALRGKDLPFLARDHEIAIAPSADLFTRRRTEPALDRAVSATNRPTALVLGNPTTHLRALPDAAFEARAVAELLNTEPRLGNSADEASIYEHGAGADLIHIAAHGVSRAGRSLFNRLHLTAGDGEDGFLHVYEILDRLQLGAARLVTLSACDSAGGDGSRGDDVVGLTHAFLQAGAPAVVSTLWPVEDAVTARFMESFYRSFMEGTDAAEALRRAQLELAEDARYKAPYYWAGYILVGEPLARLGLENGPRS